MYTGNNNTRPHCAYNKRTRPEMQSSKERKRAEAERAYVARRYRHESPENYIRYLCLIPGNRDKERRKQRRQEDFVLHCCDLYHRQGGLCALSGLEMTYRESGDASLTNISIDRIENTKGYVIGNVRLLCQCVNFMRRNQPDKSFLRFAEAVVRKQQQPVLQPTPKETMQSV